MLFSLGLKSCLPWFVSKYILLWSPFLSVMNQILGSLPEFPLTVFVIGKKKLERVFKANFKKSILPIMIYSQIYWCMPCSQPCHEVGTAKSPKAFPRLQNLHRELGTGDRQLPSPSEKCDNWWHPITGGSLQASTAGDRSNRGTLHHGGCWCPERMDQGWKGLGLKQPFLRLRETTFDRVTLNMCHLQQAWHAC